MRKLLLLLAMAAACLARPVTTQEQIQIHDLMIELENNAWFYWYYYQGTPAEMEFNEGRAEALGEAANFSVYETTEAMVTNLQWTGYMLTQFALYESDPLIKANLNGRAAGYNQAAMNVVWWEDAHP